MKNQVKTAVLLAIFLFAFHLFVMAGTVSTASLSPADISMTAGSNARISFSALNDSGLALKNYNIRISYTAGITVSNLTTDPPAATASVNTQKRCIDLVWSDIPPGTVLQAFFDIQGAQGTYTLSPGISTYRDIQNGRHTGKCNAVSIHISTDITPLSPPLNVRSTASDNAVTLSWNAASGNNITGYRLYRRTHDTSYSETQATDIFGLTFKDLNITPGVAYYYAVKSVDAAGNRSVLSQETAEMVFENQILKTISSPGDIKTARVGDVNGDGRADLILGRPGGKIKGKAPGLVQIYFGGNTSTKPDITLAGENNMDKFGMTLTVVDLNRDGFDDMVIGAPGFDAKITGYPVQGTAYDAGKIYIYAGGESVSATPVYEREGGFAWNCDNTGVMNLAEMWGHSVSRAGDINGDGKEDAAFGIPRGERGAKGVVRFLLAGPDYYNGGGAITGQDCDDEMGTRVFPAGDVNGDGFDDLLAAGQASDDPWNPPGITKVYLILGGSSPRLSDVVFKQREKGFSHHQAGADLNGDGYSDVILEAGQKVYIHFGGPGLSATPDQIISKFDSDALLVPLGDLDGDGTDEIFFHGRILWGNTDGILTSTTADAGGSVVGAGDVNNDHIIDIISQTASGDIIVTSMRAYAGLPRILIYAPGNGSTVYDPVITVSGRVSANTSELWVRGEGVPVLPDGTFSHQPTLNIGLNTIEEIARTSQGSISKKVVDITVELPSLEIDIQSVTDMGNGIHQVCGSVSDDTADVTVNTVMAILSGNSYSAAISLGPDDTGIISQAANPYGQMASASVDRRDLASGNETAVAGIVRDNSGNPLSGVWVTLFDAEGESVSMTTDSSGKYRLTAFLPGSVTLSFTKSGYWTRTGIHLLSLGQTQFQDVILGAFFISISAPMDGSVWHDDEITVSGAVSHTQDVTVTVNGIPATLGDDQFSARIPVSGGPQTITATASGPSGLSAADTVNITVEFMLPELTFSASPDTITAGQESRLSVWGSYIDTVTIDNGIGPVVLGSEEPIRVSPLKTTTYTATATGPGGTITRTVTVTVTEPPLPNISLSADSLKILEGQSAVIHWSAVNTTTLTVDQGIGPVDTVSGTITLTLDTTSTLTFTANGPGGEAVNNITIEVFPWPVISFTARPETVFPGHAVTLEWDVIHTRGVSLDCAGPVPDQGSMQVFPDTSRTYALTVDTLADNLAHTETILVTVSDTPPPYLYFSASPETIQPGEDTELAWNHNYESATIDQGIGTVSSSGTIILSPDETTRYTLQVSDPVHGTDIREVTVTVAASPEATFSADPGEIAEGDPVLLTWTSLRADTVTIDNGIGPVQKNDSLAVSPTQTSTYTLTAENIYGTIEKTCSVIVHPKPEISFLASPEIIPQGTFSTLVWNVTHATDISIDNGIGTVAATGSTVITPSQTTTYTLTATGPGGTARQSVTVQTTPILLNISTPPDNEFVNRYEIMVKGTVSNSIEVETGVTVNGIIAIRDGNNFTANHVPLVDGENTVTAVASDINGNSVSTSHTVTVQDVQQYLTLSSRPESGVSPFETVVRADAPFELTNINLSYSGPDDVEYVSATGNEYTFRITTPGVYYFTAEATDANAVVHSDTIAVEVIDPVVLDTLLKSKWDGMKTALMESDIETALTFHYEKFHEKYSHIYNALGADLPLFVQQMQPISAIYMRGDYAKYRIVQNHVINGSTIPITYYIYFMKNPYGLWQIEEY